MFNDQTQYLTVKKLTALRRCLSYTEGIANPKGFQTTKKQSSFPIRKFFYFIIVNNNINLN